MLLLDAACSPTLLTSYRDRRYEYKGLTKVWKGKSDEAKVRERTPHPL